MEQLSNKIRELRFKNHEMTQKALAERVGISRQTMNAIENCRHAPTIVVAIKIAGVLHVSVDQLFDLNYDGKPAPCGPAAKVTVDRPPAPVKEPTETESNPEPMAEDADRQVTLADLRGLIGP